MNGKQLLVILKMYFMFLQLGHTKLEVYTASRQLALECYKLTKTFPPEERFALTQQIRRAAISVHLNIAEGSSRISRPDFARFIKIATGSLFEVISQSFVGRSQGFLSEPEFQRLYVAAEEQGKMLSGLRRSLINQG